MALPPDSASQPINDLIGVQSGDEAVAKLQLAARWAERFAAPNEDLSDVLKRFQYAYRYVDSVTNGVAPGES